MLFIWNEVSYDVADSFLFKTTSRIYFSYYYKVTVSMTVYILFVDCTRVGHHSAVPFALQEIHAHEVHVANRLRRTMP